MQNKINILLIEDNPADSDLIKNFLRDAYKGQCVVTSVIRLSEGLDLLARNSYTVALIDLSLPDSSGLETFYRVFAACPQIPVIVLTGMEDESIGTNAVKYGAQDFLIKGKINARELARSIDYSIERHKLLFELEKKANELEEKTNALLAEKQKLAEAQKLAHIGSWEWDVQNNTVSWSDEFYHIHGLEPGSEQPDPDKLVQHIHLADREHVKSILEEISKTHNPSVFSYRIVRRDGAIRTLHSKAEAIIDDNGKLLKILGTGQDVTERLQEEEMETLAVAATKSYNSVVITNKLGTIEWVNEGFTKLTGYILADVKGTHGELLRKGSATGISEKANFFKKVIKFKSPVTYESKNYTKSGAEYWTITTLTPVLDKDGEVIRVIAIDSDITQRKQVEEDLVHANKIAEHSLMKGNKALNDLLKAKKQLEDSMKVKEQFLANMSHEIRTPMNAIVGFTDLLCKTLLTGEQRQYTDAIKTSGESLLVIINDILDFSKIQAGKIIFEQTEFSLSQVVSVIGRLMMHKSIETGTRLSVSVDKKIPDRLMGDPLRLNQVLLNLAGNALKFTPKGEVKMKVELLSETNEDAELQFSVIDNGIGIPKDKLPFIFDAFTQASGDTTRKYGGTGLGLAIVKQLVELQGGRIYAQSEENKGSVFYFTLKFKKENSVKTTPAAPQQEIKPPEDIEGVKVLLVEDNTLNQVLAKKVLTDRKWEVEVAENGLIAIEKVKKTPFDVVLMDIQMPEMDGYEATRYIRTKLAYPLNSIPIIAMTAHALSTEEAKCIKAGMNGYVSKPFDPEILYAKIVSVLMPHNQNIYK